MGGHCCLCQQPAQPRKKYVCAACFKLAASSRQGDVQALTRERDAGLEQLEEALAAKVGQGEAWVRVGMAGTVLQVLAPAPTCFTCN